MKFSTEQEAIINHIGSHALVSAVAGSGKTTTLVGRISRLVQRGVNPKRILVLAYNKSIKDELLMLFEHLSYSPRIETFHSLGNKILRSYDRRSGDSTWTIEGRDYEQQRLVVSAVKDEKQQYSPEEIHQFTEQLTAWKSSGYPPEQVIDSLAFEEVENWIKYAYTRYEALRFSSKIRYLEDLVFDTLHVIEHDSVWLQNHYDHILVDEYQDINRSQQLMLKAVAGTRAEIMVVGDPDQCIYEWRGSRPDFITGIFAKEYPNVKTYYLSRTFRFGHQVSLLANSCIRHNKQRLKTMCISSSQSPSTHVSMRLTENEARTVSEILAQLRAEGLMLSDIALLVRAYGHSIGSELLLLQRRVPYRHGKESFLRDREEVQTLCCLLSLLISGDLSLVDNGRRHAAFRSLLRLSRLYLTKSELDALSILTQHPCTEWESDIISLHEKQIFDAPKAGRIVENIRKWTRLAECDKRALDCAYSSLLFIQHYYDLETAWEEAASRHVESNDRKRSFNSLLQIIQEMKISVDELLELLQKKPEVAQDSVTITSIHKAKGLEWKAVIVMGLSEGEFPVSSDESLDNELEEERRLFYVAVTRAKNKLFLLGPDDSLLKKWQANDWYGFPNKHTPRASRFLFEAELPKCIQAGGYLDRNNLEKMVPGKKDFVIKNYLRKYKD